MQCDAGKMQMQVRQKLNLAKGLLQAKVAKIAKRKKWQLAS